MYIKVESFSASNLTPYWYSYKPLKKSLGIPIFFALNHPFLGVFLLFCAEFQWVARLDTSMPLVKLFVNYFFAPRSQSQFLWFSRYFLWWFLSSFFFCFCFHNSTLLIVSLFSPRGNFLPFRCAYDGWILEAQKTL